MKKRILIYPLFIIIGIILLDQFTKGMLIYTLTDSVPLSSRAFDLIPYPYMVSQFGDFFNLVFTWNPGTSFSLFRALGESAPIAIIVCTGLIIALLGYYLFSHVKNNGERIALSMIIGGAAGNWIDRIRFGAVIDFLDFHVKALHWPAFNVADICISVGVGLLILNWLFSKKTKGVK